MNVLAAAQHKLNSGFRVIASDETYLPWFVDTCQTKLRDSFLAAMILCWVFLELIIKLLYSYRWCCSSLWPVGDATAADSDASAQHPPHCQGPHIRYQRGCRKFWCRLPYGGGTSRTGSGSTSRAAGAECFLLQRPLLAALTAVCFPSQEHGGAEGSAATDPGLRRAGNTMWAGPGG